MSTADQMAKDAVKWAHTPYGGIKPATRRGLDRYARDHCPVGSFLRAILENDLMHAVGRADTDNLAALTEIVQYVHWEMPSNCHGSKAAVVAWLNEGK